MINFTLAIALAEAHWHVRGAMVQQSSIGEVLTLIAGDTRAEVISVGAHLRRFEVRGRSVIVPFGASLPWGAHGAVLAPWPNRIEDGSYTWEGETHVLPITEAARHTALHGLVMQHDWHLEATESTAHLHTSLEPQSGYPFHLDLSVTYTLSENAIEVNFTARNRGDHAAPFGVGFHPWLAAGPGGIEAARLRVDADSWIVLNERLLPTGESAIPDQLDFRELRPINDTVLDHAFGCARRDPAGKSWVVLDRADGYSAAVWMQAPLDVWQIYTDPGPFPRGGIAIEPMSCAANAFNTGDRLYRLEPGAAFHAHWGISFREEPQP